MRHESNLSSQIVSSRMRLRINQQMWNHTPVWRLSECVLIRPYVSVTISFEFRKCCVCAISLFLEELKTLESSEQTHPRSDLSFEAKALPSGLHESPDSQMGEPAIIAPTYRRSYGGGAYHGIWSGSSKGTGHRPINQIRCYGVANEA